MPISLVIGAGASLDNALYFRGRRMVESRPPLDRTFFRTVRGRLMTISQPLRRYFLDVLGVDADSLEIDDLRMEEVFKDVFFDFVDAPNNSLAVDAYIDLVELYLEVLRLTTNWLNDDARTGAPMGRLIADAAAASEDLSIITFNHDLVIENEIQRRAKLRARWCIERTYGSISQSMNTLIPTATSVPRFQSHDDGACDHSREIRILKLHGSLNWLVRINGARPSSRFLTGSTHIRAPQLLNRRQIAVQQRFVRQGQGRGRSRWIMWPIIVPPVYAKQALRAALHAAWDDARTAVTAADRLVFYGYSLPGIDIESEKLFQRALQANEAIEWVDVINPDPTTAARYADVARGKPLRWYPTLNAFLNAGGCA